MALSLGDAAGERARYSSLSPPLECAELLLLGNDAYLGPARDCVREIGTRDLVYRSPMVTPLG